MKGGVAMTRINSAEQSGTAFKSLKFMKLCAEILDRSDMPLRAGGKRAAH